MVSELYDYCYKSTNSELEIKAEWVWKLIGKYLLVGKHSLLTLFHVHQNVTVWQRYLRSSGSPNVERCCVRISHWSSLYFRDPGASANEQSNALPSAQSAPLSSICSQHAVHRVLAIYHVVYNILMERLPRWAPIAWHLPIKIFTAKVYSKIYDFILHLLSSSALCTTIQTTIARLEDEVVRSFARFRFGSIKSCRVEI